MNPSVLLEKLARDEVAFGVALHLKDAAVFEMAAALGFDAIWLDMEHHAVAEDQAQDLIRAARAGGRTDVIVRPGKGEFMRMSRMLEAGAHGVMYPRCESPAEAREVVRWAKFAPIGERGFDGSGADSDYMARPMAEYISRGNANTFVILQVEEPSAVAHCDELIGVPGVDMLMLGPADFTVLTGRPGEFDHPAVREAQQRVAAAARAAGKHWASTSISPAHAAQLVEMGSSLIFHGADIVWVRRGLVETRDAFKRLKPKNLPTSPPIGIVAEG